MEVLSIYVECMWAARLVERASGRMMLMLMDCLERRGFLGWLDNVDCQWLAVRVRPSLSNVPDNQTFRPRGLRLRAVSATMLA